MSSLKRKTSLPRPSKPIGRGTPIKKANRKRKAANLERAHGPAERRAWIKTLPCANCGIVGYSEGAHIKNGGMSRKADARFVIPLCGVRGRTGLFFSCHQWQHAPWGGWSKLARLDTREKREIAAALIEEMWQMELRTRELNERSRRLDRDLAALGMSAHLRETGRARGDET